MQKLQEVDTSKEGTRNFWESVVNDNHHINHAVVSASSFFPTVNSKEKTLTQVIEENNRINGKKLKTKFDINSKELTDKNNYSHSKMVQFDKQLLDEFHILLPDIIQEYPAFIDQLRMIHFLGMSGNEELMLYPSQTKRLQYEGVKNIAGEIRTIQTGFGDFRFNAPSANHLDFLLSIYTKKVEGLLDEINSKNIYNFVSFGQYYFTILHPFYERCGRTSEELIYLLFEQTESDNTLHISKTGWRESPLSIERMNKINDTAEEFNKRIAICLEINPEGIKKTPEIYNAITKKYFPDKYEEIYKEERKRPFYYTHPITKVLELYYFAMEGLLYDEIQHFNIKKPHEHIKKLGIHLQENGYKEYTFQKNNRKV